ncbi:MAG TPA: hypothetical protein VME70_01925 [Mycobacteriales bacterium]|nr:hypothetical protein [Mycobacteriales bacterium]
MLYALRQPSTLLGLALGFVLGCVLRVAVQQLLVNGRRALRTVTASRGWLDPFGLVAVLLAGVGWSPRPTLRFGKRSQVWVVVVAAVAVHGLLAAAGLAAYKAAGGHSGFFPLMSSLAVLHGSQSLATDAGQRIAIGFGIENLACGLLALVPVPPLELGVALWSTLPRSSGSRRLAYHFLEEQWGTAIVLVLLIVPLGGEYPLLLQLIGDVADRILHAL